MFWCYDAGWKKPTISQKGLEKDSMTGALFVNPDRAQLNPPGKTCLDTNGINLSFEIPGIKEFRRQHPQITAPVIAKAAHAMMNMLYTGYTHAIFMLPEAIRKFPNVPDFLARNIDIDCADVTGPACAFGLNLVKVDRILQRQQRK
jgi:hypothetical protein